MGRIINELADWSSSVSPSPWIWKRAETKDRHSGWTLTLSWKHLVVVQQTWTLWIISEQSRTDLDCWFQLPRLSAQRFHICQLLSAQRGLHKRHSPADILSDTFVISEPPHTADALCDWTLCSGFRSYFFFYTVETLNTWECALRQNWMENWTLIITDGELAYPNPYRAKPFPPPASFITARTLVHSTSVSPWDFCFTSCFLCYVPWNNGIQSWTLPLSKVGNCLGSPIRSSRAWTAMDFIRFKQWCYCCNSYVSHNNLLAESPECKPGRNKHERGKCAALLVPVVEKVFRVILQNRN